MADRKKELSKEEHEKMRALFAQYDLAEQEAEKARKVLDKSEKTKEKACAELMAAFGPGPYVRSGTPLTIVKRDWKNKEGVVQKTAHYFRGPQKVEGFEI